MFPDNLLLVTGNKHKSEEFSRILGLPIEALKLDIDEIQSLDVAVVCRRKSELAFAQAGRPVLVDDTGLSLAALNGFPGALVTWAIETGGAELLHRMLPPDAPAVATAVTVIGLADGDGVHLFSGEVTGTVIGTPRGGSGFGFDTIFIPDGHQGPSPRWNQRRRMRCRLGASLFRGCQPSSKLAPWRDSSTDDRACYPPNGVLNREAVANIDDNFRVRGGPT